MSAELTLGPYFEAFIEQQVSSGRYADAAEVVRSALRLLEVRERGEDALWQAIEVGLADVEAGRVYDADEVFDELRAELAALPEPAAE